MSAEAQYQRIYERERKARILAEQLLEEKSRALYDKVLELQSTLEQLNGALTWIAVRKNGVSRSVGRWGRP